MDEQSGRFPSTERERDRRGPSPGRPRVEPGRSRVERGFLEAALDCVIIADTAGRIVEFNPSAELTFGYSRSQAVGEMLDELIIPPSLRPRHRKALDRFAATGEQRAFGLRLEMVGMRSDGTEFPVELALSLIDDDPPLVCGAVRDLTRQKQTEDRLRKLAEEQAELRRVATIVAMGREPIDVFRAVAEAVGRLLGAPGINMIRFEPDGSASKIAGWGSAPFEVGATWSLEDPSVMASVRRTHRPARIDDYATTPGAFAALARRSGLTSAVGVPILLGGAAWGVIVAYSNTQERFSEETEDRLSRFTELIDMALANAATRSDLLASRVRLVTAGDEARRRIQRDIHDGAQQHFVNSVMRLQLARENFELDPESSRTALEAALSSARDGLRDLRELAAGLHPTILTMGGLSHALDALASRSALPVSVSAPGARYPSQLEAAAYFIAAEALANVAKHARASRAEVQVMEEIEQLVVVVRDDGQGGANRERGSGLRGLQDRVEALGGTLEVDSPLGQGTRLRAALPLSPVRGSLAT